MKKEDILKKFDTWTFDNDTQEITLRDSDNNELEILDVNYLIELWFQE